MISLPYITSVALAAVIVLQPAFSLAAWAGQCGTPAGCQRPTLLQSQPVATDEATSSGSVPLVPSTVPQQLEETLRESVEQVYGSDQTDAVVATIQAKIQAARQHRPSHLRQLDAQRLADWYKDEVIYMFYVDRFGVPHGANNATFDNTPATFDYLKKLGVTTLYMLPFMDSPMGDAGFDVRDLKSVREDLGGLDSFQAFIQQAKAHGFKIKSDLILNHLSDQHAWFQAALKGDEEKINYFAHTRQLPPFKRYRDPQRGIVVDYEEPSGCTSSRRLIFPDNTDTHYRKEMINGEPVYFYHTFYPFQIDINWENPKVLYEILDVLTFWSNMGVDIFRMDAIPYFIKDPCTNGENRPRTHAIIRILSSYLQATAPATIIQAEACQWPKDILPYFGEQQTYDSWKQANGEPFVRTNEVQIAYNFPYMPALWATMLTGNATHFWKAVDETPDIPDAASWGVFLRVHDELTLEMVDLDTRELIYTLLEPRGQQFRKGLGVSGRMANFLKQNPDRLAQAFRILLTLPGVPIIYYGDELALQNDRQFAKDYAKQREAIQRRLNPDLEVTSFYDSRDINRGPLGLKRMSEALTGANAKEAAIFQTVSNTVALRKAQPVLRRGELVPVASPTPKVFAYGRQLEGKSAVVAHNLSAKKVNARLTLPARLLEALDAQSGETLSLVDHFEHQTVNATLQGKDLVVSLQPYQSLLVQW